MKKWLMIALLMMMNLAFAGVNLQVERLEIKEDGSLFLAINLNEPDAKTFLLTASETTDQSVRLRLVGNFEQHSGDRLLKGDHLLVKRLDVKTSRGKYFELFFETKKPMAYIFTNQGQKVLLKIQEKKENVPFDVVSISGDLSRIMQVVMEHSGLNSVTKINHALSTNFSAMNVPKPEWFEFVMLVTNLSTFQNKNILLISDSHIQIPEAVEDSSIPLVPQKRVMSINLNSISSYSLAMLISDFSGRAVYAPYKLGDVTLYVKDAPWRDLLGALAIIEGKSLKVFNNMVFMGDLAQMEKWKSTGCFQSPLWQKLGRNLESSDNYYSVFKVLTDQPEALLTEINKMIQTQNIASDCQTLPVFQNIKLEHMQNYLKWKRTQENEYNFAYIYSPALTERIQQIVDRYTENYLLPRP